MSYQYKTVHEIFLKLFTTHTQLVLYNFLNWMLSLILFNIINILIGWYYCIIFFADENR